MLQELIRGFTCNHSDHAHSGELLHELLHEVSHAFTDTLKLIPLLFLAYLLMEYLEHHENGKLNRLLRNSRGAGPAVGALLGLVPQCGFSGAASSLFAGGTITVGTLLAIFLSTSDEMLPILISTQIQPWKILLILGLKFICGVVIGFLVDWVLSLRKNSRQREIHDFCQQENCSCEGGIWLSAVKHTLKISLLIFVVVGVVGIAFHFIPKEALACITGIPLLGEAITALIGLIPNCASSVMITNFYVQGVIGVGPMLSGLLVNAGVGILVLFRVNHNRKENLGIVSVLFVSGVMLGSLLGSILNGIL